MNVHVNDEIHIMYNGSKVMANGSFHVHVSQWSESRSEDKIFLYKWKGFITRNVHAKYETPTCNSSNIMSYVKVFIAVGHGQGRYAKDFGMNKTRLCHEKKNLYHI